MPDQDRVLKEFYDNSSYYVSCFAKIDECLTLFGLETESKNQIYKLLAGILHLGNILFEDTEDGSCRISGDSEMECDRAADLLSIDLSILQSSLLTKTINVKESTIRHEILIINTKSKL